MYQTPSVRGVRREYRKLKIKKIDLLGIKPHRFGEYAASAASKERSITRAWHPRNANRRRIDAGAGFYSVIGFIHGADSVGCSGTYGLIVRALIPRPFGSVQGVSAPTSCAIVTVGLRSTCDLEHRTERWPAPMRTVMSPHGAWAFESSARCGDLLAASVDATWRRLFVRRGCDGGK